MSNPLNNPAASEKSPTTYSRADLLALPHEYLKRSRTWFTPDVILVQFPGTELIFKDCSQRPPIIRQLWARRVIRREMCAYKELAGITGIPQIAGEVGADGFLMTRIVGEPIPRRRYKDRIPDSFFSNLENLVARMHEHGVAHGDLRRRNILVGPAGEAGLIDFETAITADGPISRRIFNFTARVDTWTVIKLKRHYFPEQVEAEEEDAQTYADQPLLLKMGRWFRKHIYGRLRGKKRKWRKTEGKKTPPSI